MMPKPPIHPMMRALAATTECSRELAGPDEVQHDH
jgi:hypothetical protein